MRDDRAEFEAKKRLSAAALASDRELLHRAAELEIDSARHDYTYLWSWLGLPIIQLPQDVVVETGIARGGSLILSASILQLLGGDGFVVGVDIDVRPHNRQAIESHPLAARVRLVEGSSTEQATVDTVRAMIPPGARVMVVLDSNHSHDHVLAELRLYAPLVTPGAFLVVADTVLGLPEARDVRVRDWGPENNPMTALRAYQRETNAFVEDPFYNGKLLMTSNPGGYLRRI